jgi:RNA polymerase sigma factor (sigma-70 family)
MSSAHVRAVLRHIRTVAAAHEDREAPDEELLERYVARRDEDAFAALLRRHGPMVLAVCRSVLHDLHAAEDAFQAAFLLLARKAGSIRRREAVSGWLYRVAYHLAVRAKADTERRRLLEQRAVPTPPPDPVLDMSLRALRALLFEELQRLPECYRVPLVLCGLEEKSQDEAARQLGWTRGAVKGRLQRGRRLLRARLRRRGLELPAGLGLMSLAFDSVSARVPHTLARATLRAAAATAGPDNAVASKEVATLFRDISTPLPFKGARIALALLLTIGATVVAFGIARQRDSAVRQSISDSSRADRSQPRENQPTAAARSTSDSSEMVELKGRVLDPDGKPLAGAKLYVAKSGGDILPGSAVSGGDGRFHLAVSESDLGKRSAERSPPRVVAVAEGLGCDWADIGSEDSPTGGQELTLRLVRDVPLAGRILDLNGRPVAGARLTVRYVSAVRGDDLDGYFAWIRKGEGYNFAKQWQGPIPGRPTGATTGSDGRFHLNGLGRERIASLLVEGPGIATTQLQVMTRQAESVKHLQHTTYGAVSDYVAGASRPIRGVVRDKDSGEPLAGVSVGSTRGGWCETVTDTDGRYELLGLGKSSEYRVDVKPPDGLYFARNASFKDTPGLGPLPGDIALVTGLTVRGRVTDRETRKPLAHARVDYHPLAPNQYTGKLPGAWHPHSETRTGPDGSFVLTVLPGPGVIGVAGPDSPDIMPDETYMLALVTRQDCKAFFKTPIFSISERQGDDFLTSDDGDQTYGVICQSSYNALLMLEPGEKETALVKDVVLERPRTLKGRLVGPDDKPVTGAVVYGLHPYNGGETLKGAEFAVSGINPRRHNHQLVFHHPAKNLGFFVNELRGDTPEPLTVKLQPCGSVCGRMVDRDTGRPRAGLWILILGDGAHGLGGGRGLVTDKDGRFRVEGLVPGQQYRICQQAAGSYILASVTVESGGHKELGDVKDRLGD